MDDGVVVLDEFSRVIDLNSAAETYIGMEKSALIGEQILMTRKGSENGGSSFSKNLQIICQPKFEEGYVKCWDYFDCPKRDCPGLRIGRIALLVAASDAMRSLRERREGPGSQDERLLVVRAVRSDQ